MFRQSTRVYYIYFFLFAFLFAVISRLVYLQVKQIDFLQAQGDARTIRTMPIEAYRGMITDRRGTPVAMSTPMYHLWVDPKRFNPNEQQISNLASALSVTPTYIHSRQSQSDKQFVYLKKEISPLLRDKIMSLKVKGLYDEKIFKRYYPAAESASQLIGFTDSQDRGQSGIELAYNQLLAPKRGKKQIIEDAQGRLIEDLATLAPPMPGKDLQLTVDLRLQSHGMHIMQQAVKETGANWGLFLILDAESNELLATGSYPSFNPNQRQDRAGKNTRLKAFTDQFEPGSTAKPFALLSAMMHPDFDKNQIIHTSPGYRRVQRNVVRDVHNFGDLAIPDVLKKSSNIAISQVTLDYPASDLRNMYQLFGLGTNLLSIFPGEVMGFIPYRMADKSFVLATFSMGYGMTVTPIQLANAYGTLARKGLQKPLVMLKQAEQQPHETMQIVPKQVSQELFEYLTRVVSPTGSGRLAMIPQYQTAGKTGTVRIVGSDGYDKNRHLSFFVGVTPASRPKFVILIMVDEPKTQYYGGAVAAPLYKKIASKALQLYQILPDQPIEMNE